MTVSTLDERTALVAVDLQNGVTTAPTQPYSPDEVVERSNALADAFRAHGLPVVLVRVSTDGTGFSPGRTEAGHGGRARPEGWDQLDPRVAGYPDDVVVTKRTVGAFHGTDLDLHLRRRGVTQVVLTGIATTMGVEGTARAAHDHGYHVVLAVDAMSDLSAEAHENSISRIFPKLGETGTTAEILDLLATRVRPADAATIG